MVTQDMFKKMPEKLFQTDIKGLELEKSTMMRVKQNLGKHKNGTHEDFYEKSCGLTGKVPFIKQTPERIEGVIRDSAMTIFQAFENINIMYEVGLCPDNHQ